MSNYILFTKFSPVWVNNCCQAEDPLNPGTVLNEAEWFFAQANDYILGTTTAFFTLHFGNLVLDPEGNAQFWSKIGQESVELTAEEFADWSTDDESMLTYLGTKLGLTNLETVAVDISVLNFR